MLRVLTKFATFVENVWHGPNTEIVIDEKHFSDETHTLIEDLGVEKAPAPEPAPPAAEVSPQVTSPSEPPAAAATEEEPS